MCWWISPREWLETCQWDGKYNKVLLKYIFTWLVTIYPIYILYMIKYAVFYDFVSLFWDTFISWKIFCVFFFFFMQQGQITLCHQNCNGHSCKASGEAAEKSNLLTGGDEYGKCVHKISSMKHHTTEIVCSYPDYLVH